MSTQTDSLLRVLLLEDNCDDAILLELEIKRAGYTPGIHVVSTREAFVDQLSNDYDVIISDHDLPQFDSLEALEIVQQQRPDMPFLVVSGTIREEVAVEAMRRGASDYLLKDRLTRLGSAIARALDVRRQRLAKEQAHAELCRIYKAVESSSDAIVITSPNGVHRYHNPSAERLSGYPSEELSGRRALSTLFVDEDFHHTVCERLRGGRSCNGEAELRRRDGIVVPVSFRADVIRDDGGRVVDFVCVLNDIRQQKEYEAQLIRAKTEAEELARMKSALLMTMSHEFRTPLTGILGFADILDGTVDSEDREFVGFIQSSGVRLLNTLSSVLELAQIESRQLELTLEPVYVAREIERLLETKRNEADRAGNTLRIDADRSIAALADTEAFENVMSQLLSNAIKFTVDGEIKVSVRKRGDWVDIDVIDTGIGIAADFVPHAFEAFKQESMGESRDFEGAGIGLAVAKGFVELMSGQISLSSRKGCGTTFTVTLRHAAGENASFGANPIGHRLHAGHSLTSRFVDSPPVI